MEAHQIVLIPAGKSKDLEDLSDGDRGSVVVFQTSQKKACWTPMQDLFAAVLLQAIRDWREYPDNHPIKEEIRAWLETGSDWPTHFTALCHTLNLAPDNVRRAFLENKVGSHRSVISSRY